MPLLFKQWVIWECQVRIVFRWVGYNLQAKAEVVARISRGIFSNFNINIIFCCDHGEGAIVLKAWPRAAGKGPGIGLINWIGAIQV